MYNIKHKITNITNYAPTDRGMRNRAITLTINKSKITLNPGESTIVNVGLATPEMIKMRMNRLIEIEPFNDISATPKLETNKKVEDVTVKEETLVSEIETKVETEETKPKKNKGKNMFLS